MNDELFLTEYGLDPENFAAMVSSHDSIREKALNGSLPKLRNRFIVWRVFLNIFPESSDISSWVSISESLRSQYTQSQESYQKVQIKDLDPLIFNPLSQASENPWNDFYQDNELKQVIRNDIDRTYQEKPLFQNESIKEMLVRVLFTWAKENPQVSYRQGMNELLAILLIVAYSEKCTEKPKIPEPLSTYLQVLNDPNWTEADIYWLFVKIMDLGLKELFLPIVTQKKPKIGELLSFEKGGFSNDLVNIDKTNETHASAILKRCHRVHHRLLQSLDKQLYSYIESQKIEPQIYLQRWLRCMLSREFNLSDTLTLWDSIFSCANLPVENKIEGFTGKLDFCKELIMIDFICIAMISFVRSFCKCYLVLTCDATGIMRRLLKFPPVEDVSILVRMAVSYKERILTGKGVSVPQIIQISAEEDPLRCKREVKNENVLNASPITATVGYKGKIDSIIELLQAQIAGNEFDIKKMTLAYEKLTVLREDISKLPRKVK